MIVSIKSYFLSHKGRRPNVRRPNGREPKRQRPNAGAQTAAPKRRRPNGGAQTSCSEFISVPKLQKLRFLRLKCLFSCTNFYSFIHSGYFYSASFKFTTRPTQKPFGLCYSIDTVS